MAKKATKRTNSKKVTAGAQGATASAADKPAVSKEKPAAAADASAGAIEVAAAAIGRTLGRTKAGLGGLFAQKDDGLTELEREHRLFESILKEGIESEGQPDAARKAIVARLGRELATHELMEEKVLYPALKAHSETRDIVLEGYQEHHVADLVMKELLEMSPSDERWGAKLKVLKESIEHHIGEEENDMFKSARSIFSEEQLEDIGARMQALKARSLGSSGNEPK